MADGRRGVELNCTHPDASFQPPQREAHAVMLAQTLAQRKREGRQLLHISFLFGYLNSFPRDGSL
jgi:hypothetical protein